MNLILLVGPPGSGKSTYAVNCPEYTVINQDSQGKKEHLEFFKKALKEGKNIIVDRMNFNKEQRERYLTPAKELGYKTTITIFHENKETCYTRCNVRQNHPTIKSEKDAGRALDLFFRRYEKVNDDEADNVTNLWPENEKQKIVVCDLDGTLCDINHRRKYLGGPKKKWEHFFEEMKYDDVNEPVMKIIKTINMPIVYCSGRPDNYREITLEWLKKHDAPSGELYMRGRNDMRVDHVVKEQILDFELLTRYDIYLVLDDRNHVVDMWRRRGIPCFQVDRGDF